MTIPQELLQLLVCPEDGSPLRTATDAELASLRDRASQGTVKNRAGDPLKQAPEAALIRADGRRLYPIRDGIPDLLPDEGIDL